MRGPRVFSVRFVLHILFLFAVLVIVSGTGWLWYTAPKRQASLAVPHDYRPQAARAHPIDQLMKNADNVSQTWLAKSTNNLPTAAEAYRKRRGRHPPPGFDRWHKFAQDHGALVVEDFFDQIYHDLSPFWGVEAKEIRRHAKHFQHAISVRNGTMTIKTDADRPWMNIWSNMAETMLGWLPDVDIPINVMDESRVIVPWEDIDRYIKAERSLRGLLPPSKVSAQLTGLGELDGDPGEPPQIDWITTTPYWDISRVGCAPNSPSRELPAATDFSGPPPFRAGHPPGSFEGYVQNWTSAKDPCLHPDLRESHGTFVEPVSQSTTRSLIPIFGGSKLPMNNDILIPPAMYWSDDIMYSGGEHHGDEWDKKTVGVIWRGAGTGGRNRENNWTRFHRHRFVSMMNGTAVRLAEGNPEGAGQGANFILQSYKTYHMAATQYTDLGTWLERITDVGLVHLECFPGTGNANCPYTDPFFEVKSNVEMKKQYGFKYLPDIDGNSFSGRYLAFLLSTSLPIKATIYSEWHDSRLIPWLHFVPMDNSFVDVYGILDYFLGTGVGFKVKGGDVVTEGAHDEQAKKIAMAGKEWAERVLRKEDMQIYVMRLLMEFARICDDKRETLGYADDLTAG
ncbi:hypothetical protein BDV95DRAFT_580527 [Massariosphaeria phaeospora]|uniref:Glycosyl transferase CAP10 domain-containing protein n=1 Tax=Massariosphaeria phaeospora TaxID=100035 RepID=A0A7C8I4X1_9PLEO|nr:hypothetical protein BDV95DRAFT_580527 [Massariosphaeria phaeospora]